MGKKDDDDHWCFERHCLEKDKIRMRDAADPEFGKAIKRAFAGELFPIPQRVKPDERDEREDPKK